MRRRNRPSKPNSNATSAARPGHGTDPRRAHRAHAAGVEMGFVDGADHFQAFDPPSPRRGILPPMRTFAVSDVSPAVDPLPTVGPRAMLEVLVPSG